jgi:hypothetical protein
VEWCDRFTAMIPRTIYPETPFWNELYDQRVEPHSVLRDLQQQGASLIISTQLICELAGTFRSRRIKDPIGRGSGLFSYLLKFVAAGIPCLKMNCQLLRDEAMTITGGIPGFNALLSAEDYTRMAVEVEKLSRGIVETPVLDFLSDRAALARASRSEAVEFASLRPELQRVCGLVALEEFVKSAHPVDLLRALRGHLAEEFPTTPPSVLTEVTIAMIRNPSCRVAQTMVRADMCVTWKAARAGALARDVHDDCYHLVNASYCDVYATKDKPQAQYAPSVVGPTEVRFYDGQAPVSDWLLAVAAEQ